MPGERSLSRSPTSAGSRPSGGARSAHAASPARGLPTRVDGRYRLGQRGEERVILNVGSVGQPRDEDPRACYALVDEEGDELVVTWRRIPYDVERTIASVGAVERLHPSLGERLRVGK